LAARCLRIADGFFVKGDKLTAAPEIIALANRSLRRLGGHTPASDFDWHSDAFYITSPLPPAVVTTGIVQFDGLVLDFKVGSVLAPNVIPEPAGIVLFGIAVATMLFCLAYQHGQKGFMRPQAA
jgi:hypothetical protein